MLNQAPEGGLTGFVERALKKALAAGRLRPGETLVTRTLAGKLGTSPTPVREALLRLCAAGVLENPQNTAFKVPRFVPERFEELCRIRQVVEGWAGQEAAAHVTPAGLAALHRCNQQLMAAHRAADKAKALLANQEFRFALYALSNMPQLQSLIETLWLRAGPVMGVLYDPAAIEADYAHGPYDGLLRALEIGDAGGVRAELEASIGFLLRDARLHVSALASAPASAPANA